MGARMDSSPLRHCYCAAGACEGVALGLWSASCGAASCAAAASTAAALGALAGGATRLEAWSAAQLSAAYALAGAVSGERACHSLRARVRAGLLLGQLLGAATP